MSTPTLLAIVGIALTLMGTVTAGIAGMHAPHVIMQADFQRGRGRVIEIVHEANAKGWDILDPEDRDRKLEKAHAQRNAELDALASHIEKAAQEWRWDFIRRTFIGLAVIALGSIAQGVAIILT